MANHPSFIDVVLLTVLMPRTLSVAKHALLRNPFMAAIVRTMTLPDDARLLTVAPRYLAAGWNVLIFPEGTRSPAHGGCHPFRRGAAHLALRTHAPLLVIGISLSRRILGKHQPPWDMGRERVIYRFEMCEPPLVPRTAHQAPSTPHQASTTPHASVRRLTAELQACVEGLLAPRTSQGRGRSPSGPLAAPRPPHPAPSTPHQAPSTPRTPLPVAALVPVFNPEPGLLALCRALVTRFAVVILVDDGSVCARDVFAQLPREVVVLHHAVNRGKGRAIKTALSVVQREHPEIRAVVFADGDGQHAVDDICAVARRALETDAVTFGVRDLRWGRVPLRSWWGNGWTAWAVRMLYGLDVGDTQTGLRAIPRRLWADVAALPGERFEFEARIFRFIARRHERLERVPIATIYRAHNRASHFRPLTDTFLTQRAIWGSGEVE